MIQMAIIEDRVSMGIGANRSIHTGLSIHRYSPTITQAVAS